MATWTRATTANITGSNNANFAAVEQALTNGTAPSDFDETAVNSVRFQFQYNVRDGGGDDSWATNSSHTIELEDASENTLATISVSTAQQTGNTSPDVSPQSVDVTDNSPSTTASQTDWENAVFQTAAITFNKTKGNDDNALQILASSVTLTIDYTPAPEAQTLTPSLFSITPTFGTAQLDQKFTGATLSVSPTFPTATIFSEQFLTPTLFTVTVTFETGTIASEQFLTPTLFSITPTFGTATIKEVAYLTPTLLSITPTFGTSQLDQAFTGSTLSVTPNFPTALIAAEQDLLPTLFSVTASFPTASIKEVVNLPHPLFSLTPSFATAQLDQGFTGALLSITPSFPTAGIATDSQLLEPTLFSVSPTFGAATLQVGIGGTVFTVVASFPTATIDFERILAPSTLTVTATFPKGVIGGTGGGFTPISVDGQGIAQEMCALRGVRSDLDWLGSINELNGGTDLDNLGVLVAMGATPGADLLLALKQLANDGGPSAEFNELMRRWAESGNY